MFDYLNEVITLYGRKDRKNNTYKRAMALKRRGDAYLFNFLCSEWTSRFHWEHNPTDGTESTLAPELIERTILYDGACAIAKITQSNGTVSFTDWRNCRVSGLDNNSFYGYPNRCNLSDYSGRDLGRHIPVQPQIDAFSDCVLIYNDYMSAPPLLGVIYYAERLSAINASIEACVRNILGTSVITCSREQARDVERQREAGAVGVPYLIRFDDYDTLKPIQPQMITTPGASEELKTLYEAFDKTHADFLQSIGIRVNNEIDKKAGITPIEIIENRMNVDLILNQCYDARKRAIKYCERIGFTGLVCSLDNFENLTGDYDKEGRLIPKNVDPEATATTADDGKEIENVSE